jgi:hypothetical protein
VTVAKYEEGLTDSDGEPSHERARSSFADSKALLIAPPWPQPETNFQGETEERDLCGIPQEELYDASAVAR